MRTKNELYQEALRTVARRRQTARAKAEDARAEAEAAVPGLRHAEEEVRVRGIRCALAGAAGKDRTDAAAALTDARKKLADLLASSGRPADALEPHFTCRLCEDTGIVDGRTCSCVYKVMQQLRRSEIEALSSLSISSFDTMELRYYPARMDASLGEPVRSYMSTLLDDLRGYADEFDTTSESLMLLGNAGLGKTHAALAIAGEVLEKGFDVIYVGIVVIGAVFVDIKGYPLSTYIPGGRNAGRIEQVHGGVSRNVAEDIANVELRPTFVGLVDDTGMGQDVIDKLDNHKVNTRYIQKVPDGMGTWLAIFDNDGDVHAAISKRPDTTPLTTLLEEKGDEIFKDCDAIAIELDLEKDTVKQVLRYARKYNKKVFAAVSNMSIAMERRDYLQQIDCFVCNQQEAGLLFSDDYEHLTPSQMAQVLARNVHSANMTSMVVTMGGQGAVYAKHTGECGVVPAKKVDVIDTTGAGDAFFAGTVIGLTYGKNLAQSCEIGSRLAASVICITENVCPRFRPLEFGLDVPVVD